MSSKIVIACWGVIMAVAILCGCERRDCINLPVCEDVITLTPDDGTRVLKTGRPKVVTFSNTTCIHFIDVDYLRKQIAENPEFDFLFYVVCENDESRKVLDRFVFDNELPVTLFVDWNNDYRRANNINDALSLGSVVTDAELEKCGFAVVGSPMSPFDDVIAGVKRRLASVW